MPSSELVFPLEQPCFQRDIVKALCALDARSDGTFLLPDLEILDVDCHLVSEGELRAISRMVRARFSASNASSIKRLALRGVVISQLCRYEMERYVPSLVIIPKVSV